MYVLLLFLNLFPLTVFPSQVEEFMLLANISVAERITADFPNCALLRRHPVPPKENYKPLVDVREKFLCMLILPFHLGSLEKIHIQKFLILNLDGESERL